MIEGASRVDCVESKNCIYIDILTDLSSTTVQNTISQRDVRKGGDMRLSSLTR